MAYFGPMQRSPRVSVLNVALLRLESERGQERLNEADLEYAPQRWNSYSMRGLIDILAPLSYAEPT